MFRASAIRVLSIAVFGCWGASLAEEHPAGGAGLQSAVAKLPVYFEPNLGQFHPEVRFLSRGASYRAWITDSDLILQFFGPHTKGGVEQDVTRIHFGKLKPARVEGLNKLPGISNYFFGQDPRKWVTNVPNYERVKLHEVYAGIDIVFYANGRSIEYDFIVKPGADPTQIQVDFPEGQPLKSRPSGLISLRNRFGDLTQQPPKVYQGTTPVAVYPELTGRTLRFPLGRYNPEQELVVDPTLVYSTLVGGNRTDLIWDQDAHTIAGKVRVDASGNLYFAALTYSGSETTNSFPTTAGAFRTTLPGGVADGVVLKLNPTGTALIFSTYLGSAAEDNARGIAIDASNNVYVAGTGGTNFPTTAGSFQPARTVTAQSNLFVTKLAPAGNALLYSTFVGSAGGTAQAIEVNAANEAVVASGTCGPTLCGAGQGLPTPLVNPAQPAYGGNFSDATLFKLNAAGSALVFSTYHGGANDWATAVALGPTGDIFVTGQGAGPVTAGAFPGNPNGSVWVAKYDSAGAKQWSARIGGVGNDRVNAIAVDSQNQPVITGQSAFISDTARRWPTTAGTIQTTNPSLCSNHFLTKFDSTGSNLVWSTFLAGKTGFCSEGSGVAIDSLDNLWVLGFAFNQGTGTLPLLPVTPDAFQSTLAGSNDFTITKIDPTATSVLFATYFGGTGNDYPHGIVLDPTAANVYVAGTVSNSTFPTTDGAFSRAVQGDYDLAFLKLGTAASVNVTINSSPAGLLFSASGTGCSSGTNYTTPQVLTWLPGSSCTVTFGSPQAGPAGTRYQFNRWEDNSTNAQRTITAPAADTTYTGTFDTQYLLTTTAAAGGTISPPSGFYTAGNIEISATPNQGLTFSGFTGALTGSTTPQTLNLQAPATVEAVFTAAVTVTTNPAGRSFSVDGVTYTSAQTFAFTAGSVHTVAVTSPQAGGTGTQYTFSSWSDAGAISHTITAAAAGTLTANFATQYQLTTTAGAGGTISPPSGFYNAGSVQVSATPSGGGFVFSGFSGALTGATNPQTLDLQAPASVSAAFNRPPTSSAQSEDIELGTAKTFQLSVNDADNDSLIFQTTTPPVKGTVAYNPAAKQATYTPNPGSTGTDSFTYKATDAGGLFTTATVNLVYLSGPIAISNVQVTNVTTTSVTITWTTNRAARDVLSYGTSLTYRDGNINSTTPSTVHSITITGLTPFTNYFARIVSTDSSAGVATVEGISFKTLQTPLQILSLTVSSITNNQAIVSWTTNRAAAAVLQYGLTTAYGATVTQATPRTSSYAVISGLAAGTSYYLKLTSSETGGLTAEATNSFSTTGGTPPLVISSLQAGSITPSSAAINWVTNFPSSRQVEYGITSGLGSSTPLDTVAATSHSVPLANLLANTTYFYKVTSTDALGRTVSSPVTSFTTLPAPPAPPASITAIGGTPQSAPVNTAFPSTLQVLVKDASNNPLSGITVQFTAPATGASAALSAASAVTNAAGTASVGATANGVAGNYAVTARVNGFAATFALTNITTTTETGPIVISNVQIAALTANSATITWTTNRTATDVLIYGTSLSYRDGTLTNSVPDTVHSITIPGLAPFSNYFAQITSRDSSGSTATVGGISFRTLQTPLQILTLSVSGIGNNQAIVSWTTNRAASAVLQFGKTTSYGGTLTQGTARTSSYAVITGLTPGTTYQVKLNSSETGGLTAEAVTSFKTTGVAP